MASKRLTKSSIDWVKFASLVPKTETGSFNQFKARSDLYAGRVAILPDKLPAIDWDYYKRLAPSWVSTIDQYQKEYSGVQEKVPYPTAETELKTIGQQQEKDNKDLATFMDESAKMMENTVRELDWWTTLPPLEHLMPDQKIDMFPQSAPIYPFQRPDTQNFQWMGPDFDPDVPLEISQMYYEMMVDYKWDYPPGYRFDIH